MDLSETGPDRFAAVVRTEWTAFRSARGLAIGMVVAALVTALPGLLIAIGSSCQGPQGDACPPVPIGPSGEAVTDKFFFMHQSLTGDGSLTARVTSLTGLITYPPPKHDQIVPGVVPWAKAGVIVKESVTQGSAYAAVMVTGGHGVRLQYDFTEDRAGHPGGVTPASPRWLRLTRSGDTITGYESTDGAQWTRTGEALIAGLPVTVQAGLFVTSPCDLTVSEGACRFTNATASFDHVTLEGEAPHAWSTTDLGAERGLPAYLYGAVKEAGDTFTVTGSGDIAPLSGDGGWTIDRTLIGASLGLIAVIVVAGAFSGTLRRGRGRGRVLAAKAVVIGAVTFVVVLAAALAAVSAVVPLLRPHGISPLPIAPYTRARVMLGTAAFLAVAAVFTLSLRSLLRHRVTAVTAGLATIVVPYFLSVANVLPVDLSRWLMRLTPAAGFAVLQSMPVRAQVTALYVPQAGYYPLAPWAGFAVACGYAALALGLGVSIVRGDDS